MILYNSFFVMKVLYIGAFNKGFCTHVVGLRLSEKISPNPSVVLPNVDRGSVRSVSQR